MSNLSELTTIGTHQIYCTVSTGAKVNVTSSKTITITYSPYTATNLITNGSFESTIYDSTNIKSSTDYSVFGSKSLKAIGKNYNYIDITDISTPINHIFYVTGYTYVKSLSSGGYAMQEIYSTCNSDYNLPSWHYFSITNGWQRNSSIGTSTCAISFFRIGLWNNSVTDVAYFDNFMIIDLTATFGSGNEPDKDWCDKHITFFDGTTIIYK